VLNSNKRVVFCPMLTHPFCHLAATDLQDLGVVQHGFVSGQCRA